MLLSILIQAMALAAEPMPATADSLLESWYKQHLAGVQGRFVHHDPERRSDPAIDVTYGELALVPSLVNGFLTGRAELHVTCLEHSMPAIELDLAQAIAVDSVGGDASGFTRMGDALMLQLSQPADSADTRVVVVHYSGMPAATGFGSWTLASHSGTPILSTLSEPYGARSWWPCKDDPTDKLDSLRMSITVPAGYTGTSNGVLENVEELGAERRFHWFEKHPIATYLVSLCVSNYVSFADEYVSAAGDTMPVVHYVYPEDLADAQVDFAPTVSMLEFYAGLWGEYPFVDEKYGHSEFSWGGGMEHQCNTSYGSSLIRGDNLYDRIVAHELAHQWWGDLITCATFDDIWLNEGFATYAEALWFEHLGGPAALQDYMLTRAWVTDPSGPVYAPTSTFGSNTVYRKGAWLLHMLRGIIGDTPFRELMRGWYHSPQRYGSATVAEFIEHAAGYTDKDLSGFWNGYLYGVNRPTYRWALVPRTHQGHEMAQVWLHQAQTNAPLFDMYVPLRVNSLAGPTEVVVQDSLLHQGFALLTDDVPTGLVLDPQNWVLDFNSAGTLVDQVAQVVFSVHHHDGGEPDEGSVAVSVFRSGHPENVLSAACLEHGIVVLDLKNGLAGWQPGDSLVLALAASGPLAGGQALDTLVVATGGLWQDLGVFTLQVPPPPVVGITRLEETVRLDWAAVPGAVGYRVYRSVDPSFEDETLVGETYGLSWEEPVSGDVALFRVRAVWP